jgi:hypothetical protein
VETSAGAKRTMQNHTLQILCGYRSSAIEGGDVEMPDRARNYVFGSTDGPMQNHAYLTLHLNDLLGLHRGF